MMTEDQIEQMTLDFLRDLGWEVRHGAEISKDVDPHAVPDFEFTSTVERDFEQVVLANRLKRKIVELNPGLPYDKQDEVVRKIVRNSDTNDILNNRDFHQLLTDGVDYEYRDDEGNIRTQKAVFFDHNNPENNDFLAVNQLTVVQDGVNKRPDIVLFVNGLPLGVIELKNATNSEADLTAAYNQIQTYRSKISNLFRFNEICITSDGLDARAGTFSAPENRFTAWKTVDGNYEIDRSVQIETLINGMCDKARFLDIIKNFIVFEKDERSYVKKLAAYHQYWVVNKALESTEKAMNADHRAGVVWHTQGSGKSLSMVFYSGKLIGSLAFVNPTIVVVTDRNDLDEQLFTTFTNCDGILRQSPVQAESRRHLRELLNRESGGVIFTTIQKFADENDGKSVSDRKNIIVIADEAHRSQYGLKAKVKESGSVVYGAAKFMRDALPNANYIGFTGTPIELDDRSTPAVFGNYIDIYDISQAEKDGATVPIYYESRLIDLGLDDGTRKWMDGKVDELFEGVEMDRSEQLKAEVAQKEAIIGNSARLKLIAKDIVDHFEKRLDTLDGKGMAVCFSRQIAAQLYAEIIDLRPDWHSSDDDKGFIKVVITGQSSDPMLLQQHIRNKSQRGEIEKRFKKAGSDLKLVIVCDMWLTGFDVPSLHTMYLDKPLKAHNLMQAIARVNRVAEDKTGGLVVDYLGVAGALRDAMATYAGSGGKGKPTVDIDDAVKEMQRRVEIVRDLFYSFDYTKFFIAETRDKLEIILDAEEHILSLDDGENRFKRETLGLYKAFALAMPHSEALKIREEVAFFQAIKARLTKVSGNGQYNDKEYKMELRQIVDKAITPLGVVDVFEAAGLTKKELPVLSEEFLAEIQGYKRKSLAARALEKLLKDQIRLAFATNAIKSAQFSELINKALTRYKNGTIEAAQVIEELIEIARKIRDEKAAEQDLGLSADEIAFYDALIDNGSAVEVLGDDKLREISKYLVEKVRKNVTTDWSVRESARAQLKYEVRVALNKFGYPPDKQAIATERVLEQAEVLGNIISEQ